MDASFSFVEKGWLQIHLKAGLPFSGFLIGWKFGQREASEIQQEQVYSWGGITPGQAGADLLESRSAENWKSWKTTSWQWASSALVARSKNNILGWIGISGQQVNRGDTPPLLGPSEATPGVLCSVLVSKVQERRELLERVHWRSTKMIMGLEHLSDDERT